MEIQPVLLRAVIKDGAVSTTTSDPGSVPPPFSELELRDIARRAPQNGRFALIQLMTQAGLVTAAVRVQPDADEFFFYHLIGDGAENISNIPAFCLARGDRLPLATPAAIAMLGYTPWELAGSDFLKSFANASTGQSSLASVLDRWGRRHELIHMPVRQVDGSVWITVTPMPDSLLSGWEDTLAGWESRLPGNPRIELDSALSALNSSGGAIFERKGDSYALLASRNIPVTEDDLAPGGLLSTAGQESSEWLDPGESDTEGHIFIKAFGRSGMFLGVFSGAASPITLEHRAAVILPILAMRLELSSAIRGSVEIESRKSVLETIEKLLQEKGISSWQDLSLVLEDIETQIGASRISVLAPTGDLLAGGHPQDPGEGFTTSTALDIRLRGGRQLRVSFESQSAADMQMTKALARLFERFCQKEQGAPGRDFVLSTCGSIYMEGFRVLWQAEDSNLASCFSRYGRDVPCEGCPVTSGLEAGAGKSMTVLRDGWIEEIHRCGRGYALHWTPRVCDPSEPGSGRLPGGAAVYDSSGGILSWNSWFETVSGVSSRTALGQGAARILERIAGPRVVRQLELASTGVFLPESVEVTISGGRRCFSKMSQGTGDQIFHFLLDQRSAGIEDAQILSGPGTGGAEGEPSSLRSVLAGVCELYGWEFAPSAEASEKATEVWMSQQALSEYLLDLLKTLAPMMPDRKATLRIASVPEGRMISGRPILPVVYGMIGFRTYPVLLPVHSSSLASIERELPGLGGWIARTEENGPDEVIVALPAVVRDPCAGRRITLYSVDAWFTTEVEAVLSGSQDQVEQAASLTELSDLQMSSRALLLRLKPGEMNLVSTLAARMPGQPIIVASGLKPRIPLTAGSILHLPLPASRDEILTAIRSMVLA